MDALFDIDTFELFTKVCDEVLQNLYHEHGKQEIQVQSTLISGAKDDLKKIIQQCNFDIQKVSESISKRHNKNEDNLNYFLSSFNKRKTEILYETMLHYNSNYGETVLNFDWLLKIVIGTSDLKTLKYPILQLILSTAKSNGERKKVVYDIKKEVIEKIINVLENFDEIANEKSYFVVLFY